jgi:hypothetical protein
LATPKISRKISEIDEIFIALGETFILFFGIVIGRDTIFPALREIFQTPGDLTGIREKKTILTQALRLVTKVAYKMILFGHDYPVFLFFIPESMTRKDKEIITMKKFGGKW